MAAQGFSDAELVGDALSAEELEAIFAFADIPAKRWSRFPGLIVRRRFSPGELIVRAGDHGTTAFFISTGRVKIFLDPHGGGSGEPTAKKNAPGGPLAKLSYLLTGRRRPKKQSSRPTGGPRNSNGPPVSSSPARGAPTALGCRVGFLVS